MAVREGYLCWILLYSYNDPPSLFWNDVKLLGNSLTHLNLPLSFSKTVKSSIMVAGPITSWQTDGEKVEIVTDFIFLDSKSTADGARRHKIKRHLVLGREAITNLNRVLESRAITLVTKVHVVKALVFPIIMCRCESQSIKKAESRRTDPFALRYTVFQGSKDKPNSSLIKPGTTSL